MGMMPKGPPPALSDIEKRVLGRVSMVRSTGYTPMPTPIMDPDPVGPTPGALQGDDCQLTYDVEIPACLDRKPTSKLARKPKLSEAAA